jgi:hypothetical protein
MGCVGEPFNDSKINAISIFHTQPLGFILSVSFHGWGLTQQMLTQLTAKPIKPQKVPKMLDRDMDQGTLRTLDIIYNA